MTKEGVRVITDLNLQLKHLERYGFDSMLCTLQLLLQYLIRESSASSFPLA